MSAPAQKPAPGAGDDDGADRAVVVGRLDGRRQLAHHLRRPGVHLLRAVERDLEDGVTLLDDDLLVRAHLRILAAHGGAGRAGQAERMEEWVADALATARVARLGTVDGDGAVRLVPVCFALVDGYVVSAVDHKPKRTGQLRRLDDMRGIGAATILVDHYDEDWSTLWWVRVRGRAEVLTDGPDQRPPRSTRWSPSTSSTAAATGRCGVAGGDRRAAVVAGRRPD